MKDKTSYFAVKIFEFSELNNKILDKIRTVLGSKYFIDKLPNSYLDEGEYILTKQTEMHYNFYDGADKNMWTMFDDDHTLSYNAAIFIFNKIDFL